MSDFDQSLALTLQYEGGKADVPGDRGGRTAYGITQATYDAWRVAHGVLTRDVWLIEPAEYTAIYRTRFWERTGCNLVLWPLNLALFDTAVLHGTVFAVSRLQAVVGTPVDGTFGPTTLAAVSRYNPYGVAEAFLQRRDDRYEELIARNGTQRRFFGGWEKRCDQLCDAAGVPRTLDR